MKVNFIKLHEVEIQRQNVTPRQFWSYCKREIERRTGGALHLSNWLDEFSDWETPACASKWHKDEHESWGEDARTEVIRYEPFGCQWYLQGSYNFIMEFDFCDEKTGFGYLYMCDMKEVPTEPEGPTETEPEQPETEAAEADETETEPETATTNEEEKTMLKVTTIKDFENMTENEFRAEFVPYFECVTLKGYHCYMVDFQNHFGYSMVVFGNGRQILHANDYELHHRYSNHSREELRTLYIKKAETELFTESELAEPLKSYKDYNLRQRYIMSLLPLTGDFESIFCICSTEAQRKEREELLKKYPVHCPAALGYFTEEFRELADKITELWEQLTTQEKDVANNYEYQKSAFYYELGNHEYHINSQGDWDTLSVFGSIEWHGNGKESREKYYNELGFTETQRRAFEDARKEYMKAAYENDWF